LNQEGRDLKDVEEMRNAYKIVVGKSHRKKKHL
jgi:hypothetical protein